MYVRVQGDAAGTSAFPSSSSSSFCHPRSDAIGAWRAVRSFGRTGTLERSATRPPSTCTHGLLRVLLLLLRLLRALYSELGHGLTEILKSQRPGTFTMESQYKSNFENFCLLPRLRWVLGAAGRGRHHLSFQTKQDKQNRSKRLSIAVEEPTSPLKQRARTDA